MIFEADDIIVNSGGDFGTFDDENPNGSEGLMDPDP